MKMDYFTERDVINNTKLQQIIDNDLPAFCEEYFVGVESKTTPLTRLNYAYDIRLFFNYLTQNIARFKGKMPNEVTLFEVESLSGFEIEKYLSWLSFYENEKGETIRNTEQGKKRKLSSLRAVLRYFEKKEKIRHNPTSSVDTPKLHKKEIVRLEGEEIEAMIDTVDTGSGLSERQLKYQENTRTRDLAIVALLLGTGIRVSELVGIDIDDLNFNDLSFVVTRKGGARVILYFSDEVAGYLYDYYDMRIHNKQVPTVEKALFISLQNKRISTRAVENIVKKYSRVATPLKNISPHKLRTTFGTQLYRKTGDIYIVADFLGHRDVNTTKQHYAAISEDVRRKVSSKVSLREDKTYLDEEET